MNRSVNILFLFRRCRIRFMAVLCSLSCAMTLCAQNMSESSRASESPTRPKVAVVLAGGGAKGFAHVGVLKVLEREGVPVDMIVGTSIGSIVGGLYAVGYSAEQIELMCKEQNWRRLLSDRIERRYLSANKQTLQQRYVLSLPLNSRRFFSLPQSIMRGQNVINLFCGLTGNVPDTIDFKRDLPKQFACVATDFTTGEQVVLDHGSLPTALYASMAVPAAFEPIVRDGRLLVDGGLTNNFPIDVARKMGADIIIGVDIRAELMAYEDLNNIIDIVGQLASLYDPVKGEKERRDCNLLIRPDVDEFSIAAFNSQSVDSIIDKGEKAAEEVLEQIRNLKETYRLKDEASYDSLTTVSKWAVSTVRFRGNSAIPHYVLRSNMNLDLSDSCSSLDIKQGIDRIYGRYSFDKVYYSLEDDSVHQGSKILNVTANDRRSLTRNLGFRVNNIDAAAILLNVNTQDYSHNFGLYSGTIELSANPGFNALAELHYRDFPVVGLQLNGKIRRYSLYEKRKHFSSEQIYYANANGYIKVRFFNSFDTEIGYNLKYYYSDLFLAKETENRYNGNRSSLVGQPYLRLSLDTFDDFYFTSYGINVVAEGSLIDDYLADDGQTPVLYMKMKSVLPILPRRRLSLMADVYVRLLIGNDAKSLYENTFVGGNEYAVYFQHHIPFYGLNAIYISNDYTSVMSGALRYRFYRINYLTLRANILYSANDFFDPTDQSYIYGFAASYGVQTLIGPLDVTLGYSGHYKKPTIGANIGYWF